MPPSRRSSIPLLVAAILAAAAPAFACGLEDPSSISSRRGALNLAFPDALHVGTAVWQAQLAGALPRDALLQRNDLSPEARGTLRLVKANATLKQLAATLGEAPGDAGRPRLALVLLGPVLWSRFVADEGAVRASIHVQGPEPGDVVVVTEAAVIEAIVAGELRFADALDGRLVRLYGEPGAVAKAQRWLVARL